MSRTHNAGIVTAYGAAVRGGYTGTYEEFCAQQAQYAENARQMEQAVSDVRDIKESVESAVSEAEAHATNASQSATNASNSATSASNSAIDASQSATYASQFADNASNSANDASQSASSAQTSANNASTSEQNAQQSAEDAQDILESVQAEGDTQIGRVQEKADEVMDLIPEDYTQMQSDIQNMSVEISNNGIDILKAFPTDSTTGDIVSFIDGADDIPVKNLTVNIEPVQSGTGNPSPDNVRPISGWTGAKVTHTKKNLFGGEALKQRLLELGGYTYGDEVDAIEIGAASLSGKVLFSEFKSNTRYTFIITCKKASGNTSSNLQLRYDSGSNTSLYLIESITDKQKIIVTSDADRTLVGLYGINASRGLIVYPEECGIFEGILTESDFVPYQGNTLDIDWTNEAGEVFGGTLNVITGILTKTHVFSELPVGGWSVSGVNFWRNQSGMSLSTPAKIGYCSHYPCATDILGNKVIIFGKSGFSTVSRFIIRDNTFASVSDLEAYLSAQKEAGTPVTVAYPLATPRTYQLTPNEVKTILGENNIFADTGDVSVEYRADIKKYIDKVVATAVSALS